MNLVNPMKCNPASTQSYTFQFSYITHKIGFHSLPLCTSTVFFRLENHWVDIFTTYDINELVYRCSSWRSFHSLTRQLGEALCCPLAYDKGDAHGLRGIFLEPSPVCVSGSAGDVTSGQPMSCSLNSKLFWSRANQVLRYVYIVVSKVHQK